MVGRLSGRLGAQVRHWRFVRCACCAPRGRRRTAWRSLRGDVDWDEVGDHARGRRAEPGSAAMMLRFRHAAAGTPWPWARSRSALLVRGRPLHHAAERCALPRRLLLREAGGPF